VPPPAPPTSWPAASAPARAVRAAAGGPPPVAAAAGAAERPPGRPPDAALAEPRADQEPGAPARRHTRARLPRPGPAGPRVSAAPPGRGGRAPVCGSGGARVARPVAARGDAGVAAGTPTVAGSPSGRRWWPPRHPTIHHRPQATAWDRSVSRSGAGGHRRPAREDHPAAGSERRVPKGPPPGVRVSATGPPDEKRPPDPEPSVGWGRSPPLSGVVRVRGGPSARRRTSSWVGRAAAGPEPGRGRWEARAGRRGDGGRSAAPGRFRCPVRGRPAEASEPPPLRARRASAWAPPPSGPELRHLRVAVQP
jgi:hypothetical protein